MVMSPVNEKIDLQPAQEEDRSELANLIHFGSNVHRHLDWRHPLDWICCQPYILLKKKNHLSAALACPSDTPNVAWVRLFATATDITVQEAWEALWPDVKNYHDDSVETIAAIPLQNWFKELLIANGFDHSHDVLMMSIEDFDPPPLDFFAPFSIRLMSTDDLPAVHGIDERAFEPVWRNSMDLLEIAFRQAAIAMVAEEDGEIIGYQISTAGTAGGHLARLAVNPQAQSHGVGFALVSDLLAQFKRRGVSQVSVNTQLDNLASLALYRKIGFEETGERYPVYQLDLASDDAHPGESDP